MTLYSFYLFNRYGDNIFYKEWNRTRSASEDEPGLVAGFVYTLQHISSQLSSTGDGGLRAVQTPMYKLHYFETQTGYRAALMTDKEMNTTVVRTILVELFRDVFTATVTKNPSYRHEQGCVITGSEFEKGMEALFKSRKLL